MNRIRKWVSLLAAALLCLSFPAASAQEQDVLYGTMRIPYGDFYAAEGVSGRADAVTSATASKWQGGGLVAGSYSVAHTEDEGGDILGVVYPVAITPADLAALGENNHGFAPLETVPGAYKIVTVENGQPVFSAVVGEKSALDAAVTLSADTPWGDYLLTIDAIHNADGTSDIGTIYGALIKTDDGAVYAMRHLENIWRDEISWSSGFKTAEPHNCPLVFEDYADMPGKTITEVTYITDTGYHAIATALYVPCKFQGGVTVADGASGSGAAAVTLTNLPADFAPVFTVEGLQAVITPEAVTYTDALPGAYTLVMEDETGRYAAVKASFVLSTDVLPVAYDAERLCLVPAPGADEALAAAFIANISRVTVGEQSYAASGKGAVSIVNVDGMIDLEAALVSGRGAEATQTPIFPESGEYALTVEATGFTQALSFTLIK